MDKDSANNALRSCSGWYMLFMQLYGLDSSVQWNNHDNPNELTLLFRKAISRAVGVVMLYSEPCTPERPASTQVVSRSRKSPA
eukprot:5369504-Amphidinium_carterae.1